MDKAWSCLAFPASPLVLVIVILFPLPSTRSYEQPSIIFDFDSVTQEPVTFETVILGSGDNRIHGSATFNGSLWFSTRTNPARLIKMNPATLEYERIILEGKNADDVLAAQEKIWVIVSQSKETKVIRVEPETLNYIVAITLPFSRGGSLAWSSDQLWAGGGNGKLARINTTDYRCTIYKYPTSNQFHALVSSNGSLWGSCPGKSNTKIFRINTEDPRQYDLLTIRRKVTDDITYINDALYVATETPHSESFAYQIFGNLSYVLASSKQKMKCYGTFQSPEGNLWAAYTGSPGRVVKFNSKLEMLGYFELPNDYNDANEIVFDFHGNMFVTCFQSPSRIVRLNLNAS